MHLDGNAIPSQDKNGQEARFEEESKNTLGGQRRSEDIPHKTRVLGPVRAKLEFHNDAGCHSNREAPVFLYFVIIQKMSHESPIVNGGKM